MAVPSRGKASKDGMYKWLFVHTNSGSINLFIAICDYNEEKKPERGRIFNTVCSPGIPHKKSMGSCLVCKNKGTLCYLGYAECPGLAITL